jgi:hypothetical protein
MHYFIAKRPASLEGRPSVQYEYRVFSEDEIESLGPEWDWASPALQTREQAQREADDMFWDSLEED